MHIRTLAKVRANRALACSIVHHLLLSFLYMGYASVMLTDVFLRQLNGDNDACVSNENDL